MVKRGTAKSGKPKGAPLWASQYLQNVGAAYQKIWQDQIMTWSAALQKAECGDYGTGELVADVARSWDRWAKDVCLLGLPLGRWAKDGDQTPAVVFVVDQMAEGADPKEVPLGIEVDPELTLAVIVTTPDQSPPLKPTQVKVDLSDDCTYLEVQLKDLQSPPIAQGEHRALIVAVDPEKKSLTPVATVEVYRA